MNSIPPRIIKRPRPVPLPRIKPGPVPKPGLEKCDCNITVLITQSEWQKFEKLRRNAGDFPPTKSQYARFLMCDAMARRIRRDLPGNAIDRRE